jgi:hypothetical protein
MALANCEQEQLRSAVDRTTKEDSAPLTGGLRDIELDAARQTRPVAGFCITALQPG